MADYFGVLWGCPLCAYCQAPRALRRSVESTAQRQHLMFRFSCRKAATFRLPIPAIRQYPFDRNAHAGNIPIGTQERSDIYQNTLGGDSYHLCPKAGKQLGYIGRLMKHRPIMNCKRLGRQRRRISRHQDGIDGLAKVLLEMIQEL